MVAVRGIDKMARRLEQAVVRKNGEGQHHLIDLGLAVAAHTENVCLPLLQQGDDLLRRIALGQVVARAVIQQIAEEEHTRRFLPLPGLEELAAVVGRAVQVRGNDPFHGFFVPFRCNSPPDHTTNAAKRQGKTSGATAHNCSFGLRRIFFRRSIGSKGLMYCTAVGGFAPCGYTKHSARFKPCLGKKALAERSREIMRCFPNYFGHQG